MIESSFAMQYGIRFAEMDYENDMSWSEFSALLAGLNYKTPLGIVVNIRSEEDKDTLKHFTKEQHEIRNKWRSKHSAMAKMTDEEMTAATTQLQNLFANAFG